MKRYKPHDEVPSLSLSPEDMRVIATIIASYLLFIRREKPSRQRDAEIVLLERLQKRIVATSPVEGGRVDMTTQEIRALANALQGFANVTRQMMPASAQREKMLQPIVTIRQHLLRMVAANGR